MIFIGLKRWDDALHFLQVAIAAPTNSSVSMIMVQAYKKYVMVCLLAKGRVSTCFILLLTLKFHHYLTSFGCTANKLYWVLGFASAKND